MATTETIASIPPPIGTTAQIELHTNSQTIPPISAAEASLVSKENFTTTANNTDINLPSTKQMQTGIDNQHYDHETVLILLSMMTRAGYGDRKQQRKSPKDVFQTATELTVKEHGIKRSAKAWQKKFVHMKQEYSALITKISESGRVGDDPDLFDKPEFYEQIHELERGKARHDPPAILCSENGSIVSDFLLTSTRKRAKVTHISLMEFVLKNKQSFTRICLPRSINQAKRRQKCEML